MAKTLEQLRNRIQYEIVKTNAKIERLDKQIQKDTAYLLRQEKKRKKEQERFKDIK